MQGLTLRSTLLATLGAALATLLPVRTAAQGRSREPVDQAAIDGALDRGTEYLHATYRQRLKNGDLDEERVGMTALALYTLLKCGVPADDDVVRGLLADVQFQPIDHTYDATCALLAAVTHDPIANRRWIGALAQRLLTWQTERGDWAYPEGEADLSNTQFAALGLWAAARTAVPIDTYVWQRLATAVLDYQSPDGGFSYHPGGTSTASMTAAGVGVLAICEVELRQWRAWLDPLARSIPEARARGVAWLDQHFSVDTNPPERGLWVFYYLYGLERVGALAGLERVGEHDWYAEGAAFLVARQSSQGSWKKITHPSDHCFALLFLKRATAGQRGPLTGIDDSEESAHPLRIAVAGDGPTRMWVEGWTPKLVASVEWPGERGQGPRVVCVEYRADDQPVAVVLGDPTRPAGSARFAAEHVFTGKGAHRLRARAIVRLPGEPALEEVLESRTVELAVSNALPEWIAEERRKFGPDLLSPETASARASSEAHGKSAPFGRTYSAELALDGETETPWLADGEDERRALTIALRHAVEADLVRVAPAVLTSLGEEGLARPVEIEVEINGVDVHRLAMDPDPSHAISLELDPPVAVKELVLHIRSLARSPTSNLVGIAEVDLFRRGR